MGTTRKQKFSALTFFFALCAVIILVCFASAFSLKPTEWKESLYKNIEEQATAQISALFHQPVKIKTVSGLVAGEIVLNEVEIPSEAGGHLVKAEKISIFFNPLSYLYHRGDILPAIYKITLDGASIQITRDKKGNFDLARLLAPEAETKPDQTPTLPFKGKVVISNSEAYFTDQRGWKEVPLAAPFKVSAAHLSGKITLKKNSLVFDLSGDIANKNQLIPTVVKGTYRLKNNQFDLSLRSDNLEIKDWEDYLLSIPNFKARAGKAFIKKLRLSGPTNAPPYCKLESLIQIEKGAATVMGHELEEASGTLKLTENEISFVDFSGRYKEAAVLLNGRIYAFAKPQTELTAQVQNFNFKDLKNFVPLLKDLDLSGQGDLKITASGPLSNPALFAHITAPQAKLYGKDLRGTLTVSLKDHLVSFNLEKIYAYDGSLSGKSSLDLSSATPVIQAEVSFSQINLKKAAAETPGIEGQASGTLSLNGSLSNLKGGMILSFKKAFLLGQAVNRGKTRFTYNHKDGSVVLDEFSIYSEKGQFTSKGTITQNLSFDLAVKSSGLKLEGEGFLGKMGAAVKRFDGKIKFTLNEAFLKNPLKNLNADGEVAIENGRLGRQVIDQASGIIVIGEGLIQIEDGKLQTKNTLISIQGKTGIGIPSNLTVSGKDCELENLQIFSYFIPNHVYAKIQGRCDLNLSVEGEIPKDTLFTSFSPLLLLDTTLKIHIKEALLEEVKILPSILEAEYKDKTLLLKNFKLITPTSQIAAFGKLDADTNLDFELKGDLDLRDLAPLLPEDEVLLGKTKLEARLKGTLASPHLAAGFETQKFKWNIFVLPQLKGKLEWQDDQLILSSPLTVQGKSDHYTLTGKIDFSQTERFKKLEKTRFDLLLQIADSQFKNFLNFAELIRAEAQTRIAIARNIPTAKVKIDLRALAFPLLENFKEDSKLQIYKMNGKKAKPDFISVFEEKIEEVKTAAKRLQLNPIENAGGTINGEITLEGEAANLKGKAALTVAEGYLQAYYFDELNCLASMQGKKISVENLLLQKEGGTLKIEGNAVLGENLKFSLNAQDLPVDLLMLPFPEERIFDGRFNLSATVEGTPDSPVISGRFNSGSVNLGGAEFDKTYGVITLKDQTFTFNDLVLKKGDKVSEIKGSFPLSLEEGDFNLVVLLEGSSIGLVNLLSNDFHYAGGECSAALTIKGKTSHPHLKGEIKIKEACLQLPALESKVENINALILIDKGVVSLKELKGRWIGKNTQNEPNELSVAGKIDLNPIFSPQKEVLLDLTLQDTDLIVAWPALYAGEILIKNASLKGPYPLSDAAVLKIGPAFGGKIILTEGSIYLPRGSIRENRNFYLTYNLSLDIEKGVYVAAGETSLDPRNILLNLKSEGENLTILGDSSAPRITGSVKFSEGGLSILGRDFTLLAPKEQEKFYPYERGKIEENTAVFRGAEGKEGVLPYLTLTALTSVVEYKESEGEEKPQKEEIIILSRLTGMPFVKEEERGIKIAFESYKEDAAQKPAQFIPAGYSEQELKVLLLPDFLKTSLGLSKKEVTPQESAGILDDYINNYIRATFMRKIERELEKSLGLESLSLEYNFGKELRKNVGGTSASERREASKVGIGAVKGFFDRFYIAVRYTQLVGGEEEYLQEVAQSQLFNYELLYKLTNNWSLSYYQEPNSISNPTIGYYKISLKGGYYF